MDKEIFRFWGKTDEENVHPAVCHMIDTGLVAAALLEGQTDSFLRRFAEDLGVPVDLAVKIAALLASLHDLGKISPGFQAKRPDLCAWLRKEGFAFSSIDQSRHGQVALDTLPELLEKILRCDFDAALALSSAVSAHHGSFFIGDELSSGKGKWDESRERVVAFLAEVFGVETLEPIGGRFSSSCLLVLAGLVSVADWIASAEEFFPYLSGPLEDVDGYLKTRREEARKIVRKLRLRLGRQAEKEFGDLFEFDEPKACQSVTLQVVEKLRHPMIVIVETPMGSGKTEAAQAAYARVAARDGLRGMYYALPTQATGNAMLPRMEKFIKGLGLEDAAELHLLHANADLDKNYWRLRVSSVESDGGSPAVSAATWFTARKRGLLASFGVGTIDQALLSVLKVRHFFVRLFGLAGKMVVLDEVHAYDAYMTEVIFRLIGWLRHCGTSVVLLSATLPGALRAKLLRAFAPEASVVDIQYPCVTGADSEGRGEALSVGGPDDLHPILMYPCILSKEEKNGFVVSLLDEKLAGGGCAACIMNTVGDAQDVFDLASKAFPDADLILFHSRFTLERKIALEREILSLYGKDGVRPRKGIVIATQVIEQSLDVDFDFMVSDIAPVDLLLQRAGRLHRHERTRPDLLSERALYVLMPDFLSKVPDFCGSGLVYDPSILLKTCLLFSVDGKSRLLEVAVPSGFSPLIEEVYGKESGLTVPGHLAGVFKRWEADCDGKCRAHETLARKAALMRAEKCFDDPGYLETLGNDFDDKENTARTRLVRPGVRLVVLEDGPVPEPEDRESERRLYARSVCTDNPRLYGFYTKTEKVPEAWKKYPLLCESYPFFQGQECFADGLFLTYDDRLGFRISRPDGR